MPRELRVSIFATVPVPDNGSAFDDARLVLAIDEHCGILGQHIVDADGRITVTAKVVNISLSRTKDDPEPTVSMDGSDVSQEVA